MRSTPPFPSTTLRFRALGLGLGLGLGWVLAGCSEGPGPRVPALALGPAATEGAAEASSTSGVGDLPVPSPIVGGTPVPTCGWPNTVMLRSATTVCSGTLVHPEVVVYAAHCGDDFTEVRFGEAEAGTGLRWVSPVERCEVFPGGGPGTGDDFAYCRLGEIVDDVPIVPPLVGCERAVLEPGAPVTLVGFGDDDHGHSGRKREVDTTVAWLTTTGEARLGGDGADACQGDSGGPAFVQLDDGSWRQLGVTSWGGVCGQGGYAALLHRGLPWLEQASGRDLTPCHDADGTWNPGPGCTALPLEPWVGHGDWLDGCVGEPVTGPVATCGPAYGEPVPTACTGACGGQAEAGCWCDAACVEQDDCCPEAGEACPEHVRTCEGWCDQRAPAGCWCDAVCEPQGDCCPDWATACG